MFRFLRSKIPAGHHEAKSKDREEFFKFAKTVHHGFPSKPSCLAYEPKLNLLAVGTKTGLVKIYGAPGVEFVGQHKDDLAVSKLFFLPNQGRIISLCENQTLHLWEVNQREGESFLDHVKECGTEDRLKKISSCVLRQMECPLLAADLSPADAEAQDAAAANRYSLLIGTESGNIYSLDCQTFEMADFIIYQDAVIQNIPDDYKLNPGAVESISVHPKERNCLLLGYNRGLMVIWDEKGGNARRTYVSQQGVEAVAWHFSGDKFISAHNDGSWVVWDAHESDKKLREETIPFGPFPCKPIDRLVWKMSKRESDDQNDDLLVFTGGMPRASYGDRHTVAAQNSDKEVVFDFTSKVVDILVLDNLEDESENPHTLLVLCEEELVAIDLATENWPQFRLPYLLPLHASPITAAQYVTNVEAELAEKLRDAGARHAAGKFGYSPREWPIRGGNVSGSEQRDASGERDILVTGHEDGSVKFWSAGGASMALLFTLNTARLFQGYQDPQESQEEEEEEWPPFRKVGAYDPYSDDPRFGIPRLWLDGDSGFLVVGGTAGQTVVWEPSWEEKEMEVSATEVNIVTDTENFVWKGHQKLDLKEGMVKFGRGFAPKSVVQIWPPASVTALAAQPEWGVIGIGTSHGFTLFDYIQNRSVLTNCLLNPDDMAAHATVSEGVMSRMKSFKKSVRDSFRRRRRRQGEQQSPTKKPKDSSPQPSPAKDRKEGEPAPAEGVTEEQKVEEVVATSSGEEKKEEQGEGQQGGSKGSSPKKESPKRALTPGAEEDVRPVERSVEARGESPATTTEQLTSLVRCLYFGKTYVLNATTLSNTFWVGTNGGKVQIHTVSVPEEAEKRPIDEVQCVLAKEIQLQHRAPVLSIAVVDGKDLPLRAHSASGAAKEAPPAQEGGHRVVLCSEEQLKTFHLPGLKAGRHKFKLTSTEGVKVRKVEHVILQSKNDENKWESFVVLMTKDGDVMAFSNHQFRRFLKWNCVKSGDISAISSTVLTPKGEGFYLRSSSEWQRFTVACSWGVRAQCSVELPEGARPPPPAEPSPPPATEEGEKKDEEGGPMAQSTPEGNEGDRVPAETKPADVSGVSNESGALAPDVTLDSIRDYTTTQEHSEETHTEEVGGGTVTITTKTTKITTVTTSGTDVEGQEITTSGEETREIKDMVNGEAEDEIAKLKAMNIEGSGDTPKEVAAQ